MFHELSFRIALAALLGLIAAGGNLLGGYFVVYRERADYIELVALAHMSRRPGYWKSRNS